MGFLSDERKQEIVKKAKSFVKGNFVDYQGFNQYLAELLGQSSLMVIDEKTGEILNKDFLYIPAIKIANEAFWGRVKDLQGKGPDKERGHWFNMNREKSYQGVLTLGSRKKILLLSNEMFKRYSNKSFDDNGMWMTPEEISNIWGVCKNNLGELRKKYLKPFCDLRILEKKKFARVWKYRFHEEYLFMGKNIHNVPFVKIYHKKLQDVITRITKKELLSLKKGKKLQFSALGTLHAMIPYFHKEIYYLTEQPTKSIVKDGETVKEAFFREAEAPAKKRTIKFLTITKLSEILSVNQQVGRELIKKHLEWLQDAGALKFDKTYGRFRVLIHPYLMFSSNEDLTDEYSKFVLAQFGIHDDKKDNNDKN